jgi:hypothetical protein
MVNGASEIHLVSSVFIAERTAPGVAITQLWGTACEDLVATGSLSGQEVDEPHEPRD